LGPSELPLPHDGAGGACASCGIDHLVGELVVVVLVASTTSLRGLDIPLLVVAAIPVPLLDVSAVVAAGTGELQVLSAADALDIKGIALEWYPGGSVEGGRGIGTKTVRNGKAQASPLEVEHITRGFRYT
jgi:hypothetical protein